MEAEAPGALPAISPESVLLRLLQRSSRNPEDLIEGAVELSLVGLLSRDTLSQLCKSVGLGDDQSATVLRSQSNLALVRRQTSAAASSSEAGIFPWRGVPGTTAPSIRTLLQPASGEAAARTTTALSLPPSAVSVTAPQAATASLPLLSPTAAASFGLGGFDVGSRLASEFQILERLGQGGGGAVYRARHLLDGSEYAIKRVTFWSRPGAPVASESSARRVLREVHALAQLNHPNVCRYYSAWVETDWPAFLNTVTSGANASKSHSPPMPRMRMLKSNEDLNGGVDGSGGGDDDPFYKGSSSARVWEQSDSVSAARTDESLSSITGDAPSQPGRQRPAGAAVDVSESSGWTAQGSVEATSRRSSVGGGSLADLDLIGCPLCANTLGGGAAALLGGSEPSANGSGADAGGGIDSVLAGELRAPPGSPLDMRFAERFASVSSGGEDVSWSSNESSSRSSPNSSHKASQKSSPEKVHSELTSLSPIPKRRHASAADSRAHTVPPSLLHQWSYRKSLLIQMELCEPNTLKDYLEQRNLLAARGEGGGEASGSSSAGGDGGGRTGESVDGPSIRGVSTARSMECLVQICQGLEHVHECGIVHRDLKPANCCFTASGTLKLMDFGLSRQRTGKTARGGTTGASSSGRTVDSDGLLSPNNNTHGAGTPSYAAPEQMSGGAVLTSCDLFPLGLIAYELFTAFGSAMERAKAFGELRAGRVPSQFSERLPLLARLIHLLLSENPANRPTVTNVLKAIQPSPASPVVSPLTSPVLRGVLAVSPETGQELLPSSIEELIGESSQENSAHRSTPSPPLVEQPQRASPTQDESVSDAKASLERLTIAVDCSSHESVDRSMSSPSCAAADWRDDELTRRLVEMELLAEELQSEEGQRA